MINQTETLNRGELDAFYKRMSRTNNNPSLEAEDQIIDKTDIDTLFDFKDYIEPAKLFPKVLEQGAQKQMQTLSELL